MPNPTPSEPTAAEVAEQSIGYVRRALGNYAPSIEKMKRKCDDAAAALQALAAANRTAFQDGQNHALREIAPLVGAEGMPTFANVKAKVEAIAADGLILRRLLWLNHGCPMSALYRDDGEMQCGNCLMDFKRATAKEIDDAFVRRGMAALANADSQSAPQQPRRGRRNG